MSRHVFRVVHVIHKLEPELLAPFFIVIHRPQVRSQVRDEVALVHLPTTGHQACFVAITPRGVLGDGVRGKRRCEGNRCVYEHRPSFVSGRHWQHVKPNNVNVLIEPVLYVRSLLAAGVCKVSAHATSSRNKGNGWTKRHQPPPTPRLPARSMLLTPSLIAE